jgi:hypothetical protein
MDATFVTVGLMGGFLFALMDALIQANPLAARLYEVYKPIARSRIPTPAALLIDIAYGFILAAIFLVLYNSLPGDTTLLKGLSFGLLAWFFRVLMQVVSQWVMFNVPVRSLLYTAAAGLGEMLALGLFYSLMLA